MKNVKIARIIWLMLGRAGLNVTTNGTLSDSCLVNVLRAWLRGIRRTLFISSWMKRCLYALLMRCVVCGLRHLLSKFFSVAMPWCKGSTF